MLLDAFRIFATKGGLSAKTKLSIYKNGFFFATGIFAGIALDNLWHDLQLGGTDKNLVKSSDKGPALSDTKQDQMYQAMLISAILGASIVTNKYVGEVIPMTAGALLGSHWSNAASKSGSTLNVLPF